MTRAEIGGITLRDEDASIIKGMLSRGDRQHDIAAWVGGNGSRIAEISTGSKFANFAIQKSDLPPPGSYLSEKASEQAKKELKELRKNTEELLANIDKILNKLLLKSVGF